MAPQTFSRLLLCGAAILTALVAIPVAVAALGEAEAEQDFGPAFVASAVLDPAGSHIGVTVRDVEETGVSSEGVVVEDCGRRVPRPMPGSRRATLSSSSTASECGVRASSGGWCKRPRPAGQSRPPWFEAILAYSSPWRPHAGEA